ncbi:restriction endonuclease [Streptomyces sp. NPDC050738]|uniref:restriction endonuclease n=1 Tax=Streptomyces sp. NPDC050738 TaxID=3154744 RepID=UPI00342D4B68
MNGYAVLHDPDGRIVDVDAPLDRVTHERLFRAVLTWSDPKALTPDDYEQVGLLLAGAAHVVAGDVRAYAERLPDDDGRRLLAEIVLGEAGGRIAQPSRTLRRVQNKARLLQALYERLDRLGDCVPITGATTSTSP